MKRKNGFQLHRLRKHILKFKEDDMILVANNYVKEMFVEDVKSKYMEILIKQFNKSLKDRPGVSKIKDVITEVDKEIRDYYERNFWGDDYYALRKFLSDVIIQITTTCIQFADRIKPRLIRKKVCLEYIDLITKITISITILDQFIDSYTKNEIKRR